MIKNLTEIELEQASGGFMMGGLEQALLLGEDFTRPHLKEAHSGDDNLNMLSPLVAMAPPDRAQTGDILPTIASRTTCPELTQVPRGRERIQRFLLCREDERYARRENYRPRQLSFRSRFTRP